MPSIKNQVALETLSKQDIYFRVLPISYCCFCVYADAALIEIYTNWMSADVHCQTLVNQQAQDKRYATLS
jgi:hypothetical protein